MTHLEPLGGGGKWNPLLSLWCINIFFFLSPLMLDLFVGHIGEPHEFPYLGFFSS